MLTDVEIAQQATPMHIRDIAAELGLTEDDLVFYGKDKAKITLDLIERDNGRKDGKLILVTAITPTPAGEGKTTTTVGLGDAMRKMGKSVVHRDKGAVPGPVLRHKGRGRGRRLRSGHPDGGHQSPFHRRFPRDHDCA